MTANLFCVLQVCLNLLEAHFSFTSYIRMCFNLFWNTYQCHFYPYLRPNTPKIVGPFWGYPSTIAAQGIGIIKYPAGVHELIHTLCISINRRFK